MRKCRWHVSGQLCGYASPRNIEQALSKALTVQAENQEKFN
jgi:hypothetical protein